MYAPSSKANQTLLIDDVNGALHGTIRIKRAIL